MMPLTQIASKLNMTTRALDYRFKAIGITGKLRSKTYYYTKEEVKKVSFEKGRSTNYPKLSHWGSYNSQVLIVEMFLALDKVNISEMSRTLNIPYDICFSTIKLFKERDCLIIKSKL